MGYSQPAPSTITDASEEAADKSTDDKKRRDGSLHTAAEMKHRIEARRREKTTNNSIIVS